MLRASALLSQHPVAPEDPALPGGDALVDRRVLCRWIQSLRVRQPDVRYAAPPIDPELLVFEAVRYKPGARLTVAVSVPGGDEPDDRERYTFRAFRSGESVEAWQKLADDGFPDTVVLHDDAREIIGLRFPFDHELPGLRQLTPDREGAAYIRRLVPAFEASTSRLRSKSYVPRLLRYKPERHAVYRLDFTIRDASTRRKSAGRLIARVHPPNDVPFMSGGRIGGVTPATLAEDPYRGIAIEEHLPGTPLGECLIDRRIEAQQMRDLLHRVGGTIARFHAGHPDPPASLHGNGADAVDALEGELTANHGFLRQISPSLSAALAETTAVVLERLRRSSADARYAGTHGDLHVNQILCDDDDTVYVVDIEKSAHGDVWEDLGELLFSLGDQIESAGIEGLDARGATEAVLTGYQEATSGPLSIDRITYWMAVSALKKMTAPIRNLTPDGIQLGAKLIGTANRILAHRPEHHGRIPSIAGSETHRETLS